MKISAAFAPPATVSILTRPGGRVQLVRQVHQIATVVFQSSPVPEDGCNEVSYAD